MSNNETKLNFNRPSGKSRLDPKIRSELIKGDTQRTTLDLPKDLVKKIKLKALQDDTTMKEIVVDALIEYINK